MKRLIAIALLLPWVMLKAGPLSESVTVESFLQDFRPTPEANERPRTPEEFVRYQKAQGFVDGVKDVTEKITWCAEPTVKVVELDSEIYHGLQKLTGPQKKQRAGPAIKKQLQHLYPCKEKHP
jgi:hypothetical protein